jgi:hypothetical protein
MVSTVYEPRDWDTSPQAVQLRTELSYQEMERALYLILRSRPDLDPNKVSRSKALDIVRVAMRQAVYSLLSDARDAWQFDMDNPDMGGKPSRLITDIRELIDREFGYPHTAAGARLLEQASAA